MLCHNISFHHLSQVAHFPPYLYHHLTEKEGRGIILILNKCDLLPPEVVVAWEHYFHHTFPKLLVVPFSSLEGRRHPRGRLRMAAESSLRLVEACQQLVGDSGENFCNILKGYLIFNFLLHQTVKQYSRNIKASGFNVKESFIANMITFTRGKSTIFLEIVYSFY